MNQPPHDLRASVRRELALPAPSRRPLRSCLLRVSAVFALLWSFAGGPAPAQAPFHQEILPDFSSLDGAARGVPELADLDGDGDLDLAVGEAYGSLLYFENTGTSGVPAFVGRAGTADPVRDLGAFNRSRPELVDLDGDGDLDGIVGSGGGSLRYFENTGSSTAPSFFELTGGANPFNSFGITGASETELVDLDSDGDLDAVVGETSGTVHYFTNTGSSTAPSFFELTGSANPFNGIDVGYYSNPALADVDGDGDLDAMIGDCYGSLPYFENTGSSTAPAFVARSGSSDPFDGLSVGFLGNTTLEDLDGDGDVDALAADFYGTFFLLENTGSSTAPAFVERTGSASPFGPADNGRKLPTLVDLDGDGDLDTVVRAINSDPAYYENTGTANLPAFVQRTGAADPLDGFDSSGQAAVADLDGDGDLDAALGEVFGEVSYLENTGSSTVPAFVERTGSANPFDGLDFGTGSSPELADLDGDGDLDGIIGNTSSTVAYLENTGSSSAPAFVQRTGGANPFNGINVSGSSVTADLVDLDADGDLDAILGRYDGGLLYLENTGSSTAPAFVERTGSSSPVADLKIGLGSNADLVDLDWDGDLDAVTGDSGGKLVFFRSAELDLFRDGFESGGTTAWSAVVP